MPQTSPTPYPDINRLLAELHSAIQNALGEKLVGLYLFGSLVIGDFHPEFSDIDLLAALSSDVDEANFAALQHMHAAFFEKHPEWYHRIEVCYISVAALQTVTSRTNTIARISPGEDLNMREADKHWLIDWYVVRERGVTLFGPPPQTLIEPISKAAYIQTVKDNVGAWREWVQPMCYLKAQAYAILTLCRALYSLKHGEQTSKKQAGLWAMQEYPQWASLIQNALVWYETPYDENTNQDAPFPQTLQFVQFAIDECERDPGWERT